MKKIVVIAENTFKEAIRNKILIVLLIFGLAIIGISGYIPLLKIEATAKVIKDFCLSIVTIFGMFIAIIGTAGLIPGEIEKRTLYTVLTKPITRSEFLLGKFFGSLFTLTVTFTMMCLFVFVVVFFQGGLTDVAFWGDMVKALVLIWMKLFILVALATLISTTASVMFNVILCIVIYLLGNLFTYMETILEPSRMSGAWIVFTVKSLFFVLPNLELFNIVDAIILGRSVSWASILITGFYGLTYALALLILAHLLFSQIRDVSVRRMHALACIGAVCFLLVLCWPLRKNIEYRREVVERIATKMIGTEEREQLGSFAAAALLGGFRGAAADLMWLQIDHLWHKGQFYKLPPVHELIGYLQPDFIDNWSMGGWHMAYNMSYAAYSSPLLPYPQRFKETGAWIRRGIRFLERGVQAVPDRYDLYWDIGWTYYHKVGSYLQLAAEWGIDPYEEAGKAWAVAVTKEPHPDYVDRMLARAYEKSRHFDKAYSIWFRLSHQNPEEHPYQLFGVVDRELKRLGEELGIVVVTVEIHGVADTDRARVAAKLARIRGIAELAETFYTGAVLVQRLEAAVDESLWEEFERNLKKAFRDRKTVITREERRIAITIGK